MRVLILTYPGLSLGPITQYFCDFNRVVSAPFKAPFFLLHEIEANVDCVFTGSR